MIWAVRIWLSRQDRERFCNKIFDDVEVPAHFRTCPAEAFKVVALTPDQMRALQRGRRIALGKYSVWWSAKESAKSFLKVAPTLAQPTNRMFALLKIPRPDVFLNVASFIADHRAKHALYRNALEISPFLLLSSINPPDELIVRNATFSRENVVAIGGGDSNEIGEDFNERIFYNRSSEPNYVKDDLDPFGTEFFLRVIEWRSFSNLKGCEKYFRKITTIPSSLKQSPRELFRIMTLPIETIEDLAKGGALRVTAFSSWTESIRATVRFYRSGFYRKSRNAGSVDVIFKMKLSEDMVFINLNKYVKDPAVQRVALDFCHRGGGGDGTFMPLILLFHGLLEDLPETILREHVLTADNIETIIDAKLYRPVDFESVEKLARSVFALGSGSIHGPEHWNRVRKKAEILATGIKGVDSDLLTLFALLHDSCRQSDGRDPGHGPRAAELAEMFLSAELEPERLKMLSYVISQHTARSPLIGVRTVWCAWDADRLDLGRVGIEPDPRFLSTQLAREVAASFL
jgi:uncharacterized protein